MPEPHVNFSSEQHAACLHSQQAKAAGHGSHHAHHEAVAQQQAVVVVRHLWMATGVGGRQCVSECRMQRWVGQQQAGVGRGTSRRLEEQLPRPSALPTATHHRAL